MKNICWHTAVNIWLIHRSATNHSLERCNWCESSASCYPLSFIALHWSASRACITWAHNFVHARIFCNIHRFIFVQIDCYYCFICLIYKFGERDFWTSTPTRLFGIKCTHYLFLKQFRWGDGSLISDKVDNVHTNHKTWEISIEYSTLRDTWNGLLCWTKWKRCTKSLKLPHKQFNQEYRNLTWVKKEEEFSSAWDVMQNIRKHIHVLLLQKYEQINNIMIVVYN